MILVYQLTHIFVSEVISIILCVRLSKQHAALIHRCFFSKDIGNLIHAFQIYVRQLVECSSQIWSPSNVGLINFVESIQRSFTKRIPGFRNLFYAERLAKIKLPSLEHRRFIYDLTLCFKIVHGTSAIKLLDIFFRPNSQNLRGHPFRLAIPISKNNVSRVILIFSHAVYMCFSGATSEIVWEIAECCHRFCCQSSKKCRDHNNVLFSYIVPSQIYDAWSSVVFICLRNSSDAVVVYCSWYVNKFRSKINVVDSPTALRYFVLGQFASSKRIFSQLGTSVVRMYNQSNFNMS